MRAKWTPAAFEEWKAQGGYGEAICYEEFLDYWRYQEAGAERVIRELTEYYGEPPNEQPPELTAEDHRLLSEAWAEVARERQRPDATRAA